MRLPTRVQVSADMTEARAGAVLVLTATVAPSSSVPNLRVRDTETRYLEYARAIDWWARSTSREGVPIVVLENSGSADRFAALPWVGDGRVQVIDVESPEAEVAARGKGYGEASLLLEAARHTMAYSRVMKCTGRLTVRNWRTLLRDAERLAPTSLIGDWNLNFNRIDTRFFIVGPTQLGLLAEYALEQVDEQRGVQLEDAVARWALESFSGGAGTAAFTRSPVISGRSASMGSKYHPMRAWGRFALEGVINSRIIRKR